MPNASSVLLDALLARGEYLERLTRDELVKILPILEAAHDEVLGRVAKAKGAWTQEWLTEQAAELDALYKAATAKAYGEIRGDLEQLAINEGAWLETEAGRVLPAFVGISFHGLAPSLLSAIVDLPTSVGGFTLEQLFTALGYNTVHQDGKVKGIYAAIQQGMAEGDTVDDMTRRLRGSVVKRAVWRKDADGKRRYHPGVYEGGALEDVSTRQAEALARTAVMHVSNRARDAVYKKNEDIFKGYQYVATLDTRTCIICGLDDGRVFALGEARPVLPRHIGDRCLYVPVLKSWKELGIDAEEFAPGTRASMDGQVPEYTTWADKVAAASPAELDKLLGPARARLYREGVPLADMVRGGEVVTIKELSARRKKEKAA